MPENLSSAIVTEDMMGSEYQLAELTPEAEQLWQAEWTEIKAGA